MSKLLTKDDIFNAEDSKTAYVDVPEWANGERCQVKIKTMSAGARDKFESMCVSAQGSPSLKNIRAKFISQCIVDEDGKLMFTQEDIVKLSSKSVRAVDRVFEACQKLNAMTDDDIEELAKN